MHIPRIYITQSLQENVSLELDASAVHHMVTVMRMKVGRSVFLFNGLPYINKQGESCWGEFEATLSFVSKKNATVTVGQFIEKKTESPLQVELGACLIKNDRMDWLLQKAVELGVTRISPLWSEFTDVKIPADRIEKKILHWQQVIVSACEQSGRVVIPIITAPQKIHLWVSSVVADQKRVLHPYVESNTIDGQLKPSSVALLVGPEGGLSDNEVSLSIENNFQGLVLGPRILRAETAPLAALTLLQSQYGDFA